MIEVSNLSKRYGSKYAVNDISFSVKKGEILGFLGPNGAGKSTTMNILTGYLSATDGYAKVGDYDILENPMEAKKLIGYLPEQPPLYLDMTVKEYLEFMYDLKGVKERRKEHIHSICEQVKITNVYGRMIKNLSKGYRQRVGLAQALLGNPDVLILDEPTVGLDPQQIIDIRNLIYDLGKKHTVILSSHILSEVQMICERIIVINHGSLVADGTASELSHDLSENHDLTVRVEGPEDVVYETLKKVHGVAEVTRLGLREDRAYDFLLRPKDDMDIRKAVSTRLADKKFPVLSLQSNEMTLEDIFLKLISGEVVMTKKKKEEENKEEPGSAKKKGKSSKAKAKAAEAEEASEAETAGTTETEEAPAEAPAETEKEGEEKE